MTRIVCTDQRSLDLALAENKRIKFAKDCIIEDLDIPIELLSRLLKKNPNSWIKSLSITFGSKTMFKRGKIDKLINLLHDNSSISKIRIDSLGSSDFQKLDVFLANTIDVIKAIRNIKTIELQNFSSSVNDNGSATDRFFASLSEIRYIRLKIEMSKISPDRLLTCIAKSKYQPIIEIRSNYGKEDSAIVKVLKKLENGKLNKIELIGTHFSVDKWKTLLRLTNVNNMHLIGCGGLKLETWRKISDLVVQNKFIKTLDFNAFSHDSKPPKDFVQQHLSLDSFSELLVTNKHLVRFGFSGKKHNDNSFAALAEALKINTTLTYLDIRGTECPYKVLADIVRYNKNLKTLCIDLVDHKYMDRESFPDFIKALENNTTLTALNYCLVAWAASDGVWFEPLNPVEHIINVLQVNRTLLYLNGYMDKKDEVLLRCYNENLKRNRIEHRVKWNCIWFVHMIKRNAHLLDLLPLELWLNIIAYFNMPELDGLIT